MGRLDTPFMPPSEGGMDGVLLFTSVPRGRGVIQRGEKARYPSRLGRATWLRLQAKSTPTISCSLPSSHPVSPPIIYAYSWPT